jgi:hypothetical protein
MAIWHTWAAGFIVVKLAYAGINYMRSDLIIIFLVSMVFIYLFMYKFKNMNR